MADTRCCGCCGLRPGSIVAAVYSMIVAVLGVLDFGYNLLNMQAIKQDIYNLNATYPDALKYLDVEAYISAMTAENIYAVVFLILVFIASILLILGIKKGNKALLIPFLVAKILGFVWYLFAACLAAYFIGKVGSTVAGATFIALIVMLLPFCIADMFCCHCVWYQYKEYCSDQIGLQTGTIQQTAPAATGGFGYRKMQDDTPPAYGAPPMA